MSSENKLPVPYRPETHRQADIHHHNGEWTSGKQGGGKVPDDLEWTTNPKQNQEEVGVSNESKKSK